jgi:SAM-dependent methyltransferase
MSIFFDSYAEHAFSASAGETKKKEWFFYNYTPFLPKNRKAQILDIGFGMGEALTGLKEKGYTGCHGIDISKSVVDRGMDAGLSCELVGDVPRWLDGRTGTYDRIFMIDVIEHIPKNEVVRYLQAVKQALNSNGILIIQTPNLQSPEGHLHRYNDFSHEFGYTEHTLQQLLYTAGYADCHFFPVEEIIEDTEVSNRLKRLRKVYWALCEGFRVITNNMSASRLMSPFVAAVASVSENVINKTVPQEDKGNNITLDDMDWFVRTLGIDSCLASCSRKDDDAIQSLTDELDDVRRSHANLAEQLTSTQNKAAKLEAMLQSNADDFRLVLDDLTAQLSQAHGKIQQVADKAHDSRPLDQLRVTMEEQLAALRGCADQSEAKWQSKLDDTRIVQDDLAAQLSQTLIKIQQVSEKAYDSRPLDLLKASTEERIAALLGQIAGIQSMHHEGRELQDAATLAMRKQIQALQNHVPRTSAMHDFLLKRDYVTQSMLYETAEKQDGLQAQIDHQTSKYDTVLHTIDDLTRTAYLTESRTMQFFDQYRHVHTRLDELTRVCDALHVHVSGLCERIPLLDSAERSLRLEYEELREDLKPVMKKIPKRLRKGR